MAIGKTEVVVSGQGLTNSFVYTAKQTILGFAETGITFELVQGGSGGEYTVRGYPMEGMPQTISIASGTVLNSGSLHSVAVSFPYEQIDVGLKAVQTDRSGAMTVFATKKRRR